MKVYSGGSYLDDKITELTQKIDEKKADLAQKEAELLTLQASPPEPITPTPSKRSKILSALSIGFIVLGLLSITAIFVGTRIVGSPLSFLDLLKTAALLPVAYALAAYDNIADTALSIQHHNDSIGYGLGSLMWLISFGLPALSIWYLYSSRKRIRESQIVAQKLQAVEQKKQQRVRQYRQKKVSEQITSIKKALKTLESMRQNNVKGQDGEDMLAAILGDFLDDNWTLYRNLSLEINDKSKADIDAVLIGKTGVFVIEVKNKSTDERITGDFWEYKTKSGWVRKDNNPAQQLRANTDRLSAYLKRCNANVTLYPRLAWVGNGRFDIQNQPDNQPIRAWYPSQIDFLKSDISRQSFCNGLQIQSAHNALKIRMG